MNVDLLAIGAAAIGGGLPVGSAQAYRPEESTCRPDTGAGDFTRMQQEQALLRIVDRSARETHPMPFVWEDPRFNMICERLDRIERALVPSPPRRDTLRENFFAGLPR